MDGPGSAAMLGGGGDHRGPQVRWSRNPQRAAPRRGRSVRAETAGYFTARRAESEARANERFAASLSHAAAFELVAVLRDEGCDWSSIADELNTDGLHYEGHRWTTKMVRWAAGESELISGKPIGGKLMLAALYSESRSRSVATVREALAKRARSHAREARRALKVGSPLRAI